MVHGLATNLAFWYPSATQLSRTCRVTIFDLRGHGKSSMPEINYSPLRMAMDLKELLDELKIDSCCLVGHSFGGSVVLHFACLYPERIEALILADVRLKCFQPEQKPRNWSYWDWLLPKLKTLGIQLDEDDPEGGYRLLTEVARLQVGISSGKTMVPSSLRNFLPQIGNKRTAQRWLTLVEGTTIQKDLHEPDRIGISQLQMIDNPVLSIYGEHSPNRVTGDSLKLLLPRSEFATVSNSGHFFPLSNANKFVELAQGFLTRIYHED